MKKYFVSYVGRRDDFKGFGNCIKTSLKNQVSIKDIKLWEGEIKVHIKVDAIKILNFQELKG